MKLHVTRHLIHSNFIPFYYPQDVWKLQGKSYRSELCRETRNAVRHLLVITLPIETMYHQIIHIEHC